MDVEEEREEREERFEEKRFENLGYLIRYPKGFDPKRQYPLILLLHGSGTRGIDLNMLRVNDFFIITSYYESFDFVTIAPQCHEDTWFDLWETLKRFVDEITGFSFCDPRRVYAVGPSMGGYATWQIAMSMPQYFAAIVPICGGGMYWNAERLKNVPVWAFHGERDTLVRVEESVKMVEAVNRCGGKAKLTVIPNVYHEAWIDAYEDRAVFDWLLSNRK